MRPYDTVEHGFHEKQKGTQLGNGRIPVWVVATNSGDIKMLLFTNRMIYFTIET
jgi:hypothetical protein